MNAESKGIFSRLRKIVEQGDTSYAITLISGPPEVDNSVGQVMLLFTDGISEGTIHNSEITDVVLERVVAQAKFAPILFGFEYNNEQYRIFMNYIAPKPKAVILGGGHISQPLTEILVMLDYRVTVIDDRPDFANRVRFPRAESVICDSFAKAVARVPCDSSTAVIIVTRGHRYDIECLRMVLTYTTKYLGLISSRSRVRAILDTLKAEGIDPQRLKDIKSPIGLDIGAQTPTEIAVSIAAEMIVVYQGDRCHRPPSVKEWSHG